MRRKNDQYNTPDSLAQQLIARLPIRHGDMALEPHAGGGAFCRALQHIGASVMAQDIDPTVPALHSDRSWPSSVGNFLESQYYVQPKWVIGNPPYTDADKHIEQACTVTGQHVAFLLRLAILSSKKRRPLWTAYPPRHVWVLPSRPSFTGMGTDKYDYAWIWWDLKYEGTTTLGWL